MLDAAAASSISFNGATPFATTSNLSASTTKSILVNGAASISAVAGTIGLTSTAAEYQLGQRFQFEHGHRRHHAFREQRRHGDSKLYWH